MPINWGFAEVMAYATLIDEGIAVRLTGQDVGVVPFRTGMRASQSETRQAHHPAESSDEDVTFDLYDSLLSEEAVLAFEYGYSTTAPRHW